MGNWSGEEHTETWIFKGKGIVTNWLTPVAAKEFWSKITYSSDVSDEAK